MKNIKRSRMSGWLTAQMINLSIIKEPEATLYDEWTRIDAEKPRIIFETPELPQNIDAKIPFSLLG